MDNNTENNTPIDAKLKILEDELKIIEDTNNKFKSENESLKNEINSLNSEITSYKTEIFTQRNIIEQFNIDKSELEFLRMNLIYSHKCQTRKLFSTGYTVGTPEYKNCIMNKGKKVNE